MGEDEGPYRNCIRWELNFTTDFSDCTFCVFVPQTVGQRVQHRDDHSVKDTILLSSWGFV